MSSRIAAFEKVSLTRYQEALSAFKDKGDVCALYGQLSVPRRATSGSAGYDFFAPFAFTLQPGESITVPTGFRVRIQEGWVLCIFPRSGFGFKYRLQLNNTVGIIDSDYYFADNEGHIFIKLFNDSREGKTVSVAQGEAFAQGVFMPFGLTMDDEVSSKRIGGLGSTSKQKV